MEKTAETLSAVEATVEQLSEGDGRLDAAFYEGKWAWLAVRRANTTIGQLGQHVQKVFYPNRFARVFVTEANGVPFMGSRSIFFYPATAEKFLAPSMDILPSLYVQKNWTLVTRSGTVGRVLHTGQYLEGQAVTEDVIRVVPKNIESGYVTAYLQSKFGNALLTTSQFGAVINHLEPSHIENLPFPLFEEVDRLEIDRLMQGARILRERGARLIARARQDFYKFTKLPKLETLEAPYLNSSLEVRAFEISVDQMQSRLDASYHIPEAELARETLAKSGLPVKQLGETANVYIPGRFKRVYVQKESGTPFLQGSHIPTLYPLSLKYLSKKAHPNQHVTHILSVGDVLVSCSGTLGRIGLVSDALSGWLGSQHIARVSPKLDLHNGYLYIFFQTPYGQRQILAQTYGAVIDELSEDQLRSVSVPIIDQKIQRKIGEPVLRAFALRDQANKLEQRAIQKLENLIEGN